ncbi:hypothetical protein [Streptomyces chartreusis]
MTRAFATAQGIAAASIGTAALESSPTPPPHTTNRTNEERGPGLDGAGLGFDWRCDSMAASFRAGGILNGTQLIPARLQRGLRRASAGIGRVSAGGGRAGVRPG